MRAARSSNVERRIRRAIFAPWSVAISITKYPSWDAAKTSDPMASYSILSGSGMARLPMDEVQHIGLVVSSIYMGLYSDPSRSKRGMSADVLACGAGSAPAAVARNHGIGRPKVAVRPHYEGLPWRGWTCDRSGGGKPCR